MSRPAKNPELETPEFLTRLKEADEAAFQQLFEAFYNRVYNLSLRLTRNPDEAEEVLQETFLSVFDKIHTFEGRSRLSTWIYAIASNGALSRLRKKSETAVTFDEDLPLNVDTAWFRNGNVMFDVDTEDPVVIRELEEKLKAAIETLPDGYRELFVLKEVEKFSVREVAEMFDLKPGAVKTRLHRARLMLRARLSDYWASTEEPEATAK